MAAGRRGRGRGGAGAGPRGAGGRRAAGARGGAAARRAGDPEAGAAPPRRDAGWTFLTNHAHVLLAIAAAPEHTLREVAETVGITERAVQRIVGELEAAGYLHRDRSGRRNTYALDPDLPLRHPLERHHSVKALIALVLPPADPRRGGR